MQKERYYKNAMDMIYLLCCAVNAKTPDSGRVSRFSLDDLFQVCQEHSLTACTAYALESAGIKHHKFIQAKEKSIRKTILMDVERNKILNQLEQEKIWYMPLKGVFIKEWYPKIGMRQMSDNDILFDKNFQQKVKEIMLNLDFTFKDFVAGKDETYCKEPIYSFEMHINLFDAMFEKKFYEYYAMIKEKLVKDTQNQYGYHFKPEDFYIYMVAHEYMHYLEGGTGIRSLLDIYIFIRKFNNSLDWNYINKELRTLKILNYEQSSRQLALKVFSEQELSLVEQEQLEYYIFSGTYGTMENRVKSDVVRYGNGSKLKYLLYRAFPPLDYLQSYVPWAKYKILIPAAWFYRLIVVFRKNTTRFWYLVQKDHKKT